MQHTSVTLPAHTAAHTPFQQQQQTTTTSVRHNASSETQPPACPPPLTPHPSACRCGTPCAGTAAPPSPAPLPPLHGQPPPAACERPRQSRCRKGAGRQVTETTNGQKAAHTTPPPDQQHHACKHTCIVHAFGSRQQLIITGAMPRHAGMPHHSATQLFMRHNRIALHHWSVPSVCLPCLLRHPAGPVNSILG
jgi:hypothetical protein